MKKSLMIVLIQLFLSALSLPKCPDECPLFTRTKFG